MIRAELQTKYARLGIEGRRALEGAWLTTPDGMPLVWWGQLAADAPVDRVYGPDVLQRVLLAYMSDSYLLSTALMPHGRAAFDPGILCASLDHALWFHGDIDCSEWLLYVMDSPRASGGRGLSRGSIFNRDGVLVASTAQEALLRARR